MTDWKNYKVRFYEAGDILNTTDLYEWRLKSVDLIEQVVYSKDAPEDYRGEPKAKLVAEGKEIDDKWCADMLVIHFLVNGEIEIKESYWLQAKLAVNDKNPEYQSKFVTLLQKLGTALDMETEAQLGELLVENTTFKAHAEQVGDSIYHRLNHDSITDVTIPKQPKSKPQEEEPDKSEMKKKIWDLLKGVKSKTKATEIIFEQADADIFETFAEMVQDKELKFEEK